MSCGSLCSCHFKWPMDAQGSKRDPINSEKAWLDFAVRLLSREVVGKGKGQETVWSERCKPHWWDERVELPWKNPTANPKDTKEVLLKKYTALERKLREESRFPVELEEESRLWNEQKYKELFLQTSLVSLLGKVTGVHLAVADAFEKVKELKAHVNVSLVNDLQKCLLATHQVTEHLKTRGCDSNKPAKRPSSSKENVDVVPEKLQKLEKPALHSEFQQRTHSSLPCSIGATEAIVSCGKNFKSRGKSETKSARSIKKHEQKLQPKPASVSPAKLCSVAMTTCGEAGIQFMTLQPVMSTENIILSQKDLSHLLLGDQVAFSEPDVCSNVKPPSDMSVTNMPRSSIQITDPLNKTSANKSFEKHNNIKVYAESHNIVDNENTDMSRDSDTLNDHILPQNTHNSSIPEIDFLLSPANIYTVNANIVHINSNDGINNKTNVDGLCNKTNFENHSNKTNVDSLSSKNSVDSHSYKTSINSHSYKTSINSHSYKTSINSHSYKTSINSHSYKTYVDSLSNKTSIDNYSYKSSVDSHSYKNSIQSLLNDDSNTEMSNRSSPASTEHSTYSTEHSMLDLDNMYSPDEQNQLWKEDGSYLLDRFLDDLDASAYDSTTESYH